MKMSIEQIRSEISRGRLEAISIDTSIFDRQGRALERGLLKRLRQFSFGRVAFVLTDVVFGELRAHVVEDCKSAEADLRKGFKAIAQTWQVPEENSLQAHSLLLGAHTAESIAQQRLDLFRSQTGMEVVRAEKYASMSELLRRYFASMPPFGVQPTKKHEFPDALALLTLEAWAVENEAIVLVVTQDGDWLKYAEQSERMVALSDLSAALSCFQDEAAEYISAQIAGLMKQPGGAEILAAIKRAVEEQSEKLSFSAEAESQFAVSDDGVDAEVEFLGIADSPYGYSLEPVEYDGESSLVVRMTAYLEAKITAHFSFRKWDSIDREFIPCGKCRANRVEPITAEILVTFGGDLPDSPSIKEVELIPQEEYLEFAEIEPDWMGIREDEE